MVETLIFGNWSAFGGPLRFLTIWALVLSFVCGGAMLARSLGRTERRFDGIVSATAVINVMVVILYWRIYLSDPTAMRSDGQPGVWWREYYLHGLGPLLQWIDATLIHRSFRRLGFATAWLVGLIVAYLSWAELLVQPRNDSPAGSVTSGMPYPFLNDLAFDARMEFYVTNLAVGILLLGIFAAIAFGARRIAGLPASATGPGVAEK